MKRQNNFDEVVDRGVTVPLNLAVNTNNLEDEMGFPSAGSPKSSKANALSVRVARRSMVKSFTQFE